MIGSVDEYRVGLCRGGWKNISVYLPENVWLFGKKIVPLHRF